MRAAVVEGTKPMKTAIAVPLPRGPVCQPYNEVQKGEPESDLSDPDEQRAMPCDPDGHAWPAPILGRGP